MRVFSVLGFTLFVVNFVQVDKSLYDPAKLTMQAR
jgi:hypothetical protein